MTFEKFVRRPRVETKHHRRASSLQTVPASVCMSSLLFEMPTSCLVSLSLPTWPSSAKSLQEFAAVLQNLEDERTRMVSDPTNCPKYERQLKRGRRKLGKWSDVDGTDQLVKYGTDH